MIAHLDDVAALKDEQPVERAHCRRCAMISVVRSTIGRSIAF